MSIRTFRAENLQAALKQIRDELGADATILETRQVREGFWGCFGRLSVEVTASICEKSDYFFISEPRDSNSSTRSSSLSFKELPHKSAGKMCSECLELRRKSNVAFLCKSMAIKERDQLAWAVNSCLKASLGDLYTMDQSVCTVNSLRDAFG